jgi:hypothetical protein
MSRTVSAIVNLILLVLMLVGFWLANSHGITFLIGLLLILGAAVGVIVLARRGNSLPLKDDDRAAWEIVRAKGKRFFILRALRQGFFLGLLFLGYELIRSHWKGEPFTATDGFLLLALFFILYICSAYLAAIKKWSLYEERYKESLRRAAPKS